MAIRTGLMTYLTINLSVRRERIETTEIDRIWDGSVGRAILGIGCMTAVFHCEGTVDV